MKNEANATQTKHSADCSRVFSRLDPTCGRCVELASGSKPRAGWGDQKRRFEAAAIAAIRTHNCASAHCGPVCTFGDF